MLTKEISTICPNCHQPMRVPIEFEGQNIICPNCLKEFKFPVTEVEQNYDIPSIISDAPASNLSTEQTQPCAYQATEHTQPCAYCGQTVIVSQEKKCKQCGEVITPGNSPLLKRQVIQTNVRQGGLLGGIFCFIIGMTLMYYLPGFYIVYLPLFFAAFTLSIIAMAQRRILGGLLLLLITLMGPLFLLTMIIRNVSQAESRQAVLVKNCIVEEPLGYLEGDFMHFRGRLKNNNEAPLNFIKIKVEWMDIADNVIETDWTYVGGKKGISPGEIKNFEIMSPADPRMKHYRYWVER